jgi:hypothetical protein
MGREALEHRVRVPRRVPGRFEQVDRAVDRLANGLARPRGLIEGAMEDVPTSNGFPGKTWPSTIRLICRRIPRTGSGAATERTVPQPEPSLAWALPLLLPDGAAILFI